jgi:hypothetical protein
MWLVDLVKYCTSSFWTWAGSMTLLTAIFGVLAAGAASFRLIETKTHNNNYYMGEKKDENPSNGQQTERP